MNASSVAYEIHYYAKGIRCPLTVLGVYPGPSEGVGYEERVEPAVRVQGTVDQGPLGSFGEEVGENGKTGIYPCREVRSWDEDGGLEDYRDEEVNDFFRRPRIVLQEANVIKVEGVAWCHV